MLTSFLRLAWQLYREQRRSDYSRYIRWTQTILMVFIVTLSQTSQSIQSYLTTNLNNLLGADVVIANTHALSDAQLEYLGVLSNSIVHTKQTTATLNHNGTWQSARLKAVGDDYPLQGNVHVSASQAGQSMAVETGPKPGNIWLDSRLMSRLSIGVGDTLILAEQQMLVEKMLVHEPDRLMEGHSVAMRALMHKEDLQRLGGADDLIQHRYLIAANANQIDAIVKWQEQTLPAAQIFHKQGAHPLALFWKRTENFLGLASVILFFMAGIAIEQLAQVQMKKEQFFTAVCMSVGASKKWGVAMSFVKWGMGIAILLPTALAISIGLHWVIIYWLADTFPDLSWHWDMLTSSKAVLTVVCIFMLFNAPIWLTLKQATVNALIHQTEHASRTWLTKGSAFVVLVLVTYIYSDNGLLTTMVLASMVICILLIIALSWGALTLGETCTQGYSGLVPFTLFMMKKRIVSKSTQILGVGLCAFLLLFTLMLLRDLGASMSAYQRQHDGNLLVSQASATQMSDIRAWAELKGVEIRQHKPFVFAKLLGVNGQSLNALSDKPSESMATLSKAIRIHWTDSLPANNRLVEGNWWHAADNNWRQVSVESEVMTDLGLTLGDTLTFFINNQRVDFTLVASHAYRPGAGSITFWVQIPNAAMSHIQTTHYAMASLELHAQHFSMLGELWQRHPTLRMVSLKALTERFDSTLAMVTKVIGGFSVVIIMLATIVILSSIKGFELNEKKKNSVIISFGFSRRTCLQLNVIEWSVTGGIAALGAIAGTYIAGVLIYQSQFSMRYNPNAIWLVGTLAVIIVFVIGLGSLASKTSLNARVRELLSE